MLWNLKKDIWKETERNKICNRKAAWTLFNWFVKKKAMDTIINLLKTARRSYNFFPGANVSLIMLINKTDGRFSTIFF